MRIALYTTSAMYPPELFETVSGHVQVALKTVELLVQAGHDVTLVTTEAPANYGIPPIFALSGVKVRTVKKATKAWPKHHTFSFVKAAQQVQQLYKLMSSNEFDAVHFIGSNKTAHLLGFLKLLGLKKKSGATLVLFSEAVRSPVQAIESLLLGKLDCITTLTEFSKSRLLSKGAKHVTVTRPGVIRDLNVKDLKPFRVRPEAKGMVLFWRDATLRNGADIALEVFRKLSSEFPEIDFVFAVRPNMLPHEPFSKLLPEINLEYKNIHLMVHPYPEGVTLGCLLASAACVVLPFRLMSINPQFAVLETLIAGAPLITTNVESNPELGEHGRTFILTNPNSVDETLEAVRKVLNNPEESQAMGRLAMKEVPLKWNWDSYLASLLDAYSEVGEGNSNLR